MWMAHFYLRPARAVDIRGVRSLTGLAWRIKTISENITTKFGAEKHWQVDR
jgi:hypothetical protein